MNKHTPGPWIAVGNWVEHPSDQRPDICNCDPKSMGQTGRSDAEICANAHLIAAAPELLEVLRSFTKSSYIRHQHPKRFAAAVAAIARAEGGTP